MNWDKFYDIVIAGKKDGWEVAKQLENNKTVLLINHNFKLYDDNGNKGSFSWMLNRKVEENAQHSRAQGSYGRVLMGGLGIGYDAFMLSYDPNVTSIVIVEKEKEVIDLVKKYITHPKINIIHDRILHYMQTTKEIFDTTYFDIFPDSPTLFPKEVNILTKESKRLGANKILFWMRYKPLEL